MNIRFNYLYRDAGNYKVYGDIIFKNPDNLLLSEIQSKITEKLVDGQFFNPDKLDVPKLKHLGFPYDSDMDHSWYEFISVEETVDSITDMRTISTFLNNLTSTNSLE